MSVDRRSLLAILEVAELGLARADQTVAANARPAHSSHSRAKPIPARGALTGLVAGVVEAAG
jgi:hypothetical protein